MNNKESKAEKLREILKESPNGIWIREISRKSGLDKSTISRYLVAMGDEIEFEFFGRNKVYRLK